MSNIFATLRTTGDILKVYERCLQVTQNNITNASTPGYARREITTIALPFGTEPGSVGGAKAGPVTSARSAFAERVVRRQTELLGRSKAETELLAGIEAAFPINGDAGVAGALNRLLQSFSSWSLTPNDPNARQAVLDEAQGLAHAFADTAAQLSEAARLAEVQLRDTVREINELAGVLRDANEEIRSGARTDAGVDARIHATLEALSELVDFTAVQQQDGTYMVLAGGMAPLVIGDRQYEITMSFGHPEDPAYPEGPLSVRLLDSGGADITARITGGKLAGALDVRNNVLAGLIGDGSQPGDLNRLAVAVAERVNGLLLSGWTADGFPPGEDLFHYDAYNHTAAARHFSVNPAFTPDMLAAIDPGPPYVSNGIALKLAGLAVPQDPADTVDGVGFIAFYAGMAGRVGRQSAEAQQTSMLQAEAVAQARGMRSEASGVSLDQEAVLLMAYQRAYQAAANMIAVLNEMTGIAVNLLR